MMRVLGLLRIGLALISTAVGANGKTPFLLSQSVAAPNASFYLYDEGLRYCQGGANVDDDAEVRVQEREVTFESTALGMLLKFHRGTCFVSHVVPRSAAADAGVQKGEVLLRIQDRDVLSDQNVDAALQSIRSSPRPLTIRFQRSLTIRDDIVAPPWICGCWSKHFDEIASTLARHPARTTNPYTAGFLIPLIDTAAETNYPIYGQQQGNMVSGEYVECHRRERRRVVEDRNALKYIDKVKGRHVLFDFDPTDNSLIEFASSRSDIVIAKNSACSIDDAVGRQNGLRSYFFDVSFIGM